MTPPDAAATTIDPATRQRDAVAAARAHHREHGPAILRDFTELCAIPNVSRDLDGVRRNADAIRERFAARGIELRLAEQDGVAPLLHGRLDAPGATTTLGIYLHYDGQPVDPANWRHGPFEPTLYTDAFEAGGEPIALPDDGAELDPEWRLYARGTGDDRAPVAAILGAIDALAHAGIERGVNLVFAFEGEEEIGSPHLPDYLADLADDLQADAWLICDGPVHQSRAPQIVFGVRGFTGVDITVYGPSHELHSGHYGNWAPNPALALAHLLASLKSPDGTVHVEGFEATARSMTAAERDAIAALPDHDEVLRDELGFAASETGERLAERLMTNSMNVRGLASAGVGDAARNVVPDRATASIDMRLAPGAEPDEVYALLVSHLQGQGHHVLEGEQAKAGPNADTRSRHGSIVGLTREIGYPGVRTSPGLPIAQRIIAAAEAASGADVIVLPTFGGSVPLHGFTEALHCPVVIVPIANHDDNQHAPDENLRVGNLCDGIELMAAILTLGPESS